MTLGVDTVALLLPGFFSSRWCHLLSEGGAQKQSGHHELDRFFLCVVAYSEALLQLYQPEYYVLVCFRMSCGFNNG